MTCEHRHVTAIPGGRYACADDLNCRSTFAVSSDRVSADDLRTQLGAARAGLARSERSVAHLTARVTEGEELLREGCELIDSMHARMVRLTAQRDSARDCAALLEGMLAEADDKLAEVKAALLDKHTEFYAAALKALRLLKGTGPDV